MTTTTACLGFFIVFIVCLSVQFSSLFYGLARFSFGLDLLLVGSIPNLFMSRFVFFLYRSCLSVRPSVVFSFLFNFVDVVVVVINVGGWMAASSVGRVYSRFFSLLTLNLKTSVTTTTTKTE